MWGNKFDLELVEASGLFEAEWYRAKYPDVDNISLSPLEHFVWIGGALGRSPSANFDSQAYFKAHPQAMAEGANPLLHFLKNNGLMSADVLLMQKHGLSFFAPDEQYPYRPHLQRLVNSVRARIAEERNGPAYEEIEGLIDLPFFVQKYPDLIRANVNPILHYLSHGRREGRQLWPDFSPSLYKANNPHVGKEDRDVHLHYLEEGRKQHLPTSECSVGSEAFEQYCSAFGLESEAVERARRAKLISLRSRMERGKLGEMIAKAEQIEPLISQGWLSSLSAGVSPLRSEAILRFMTAMRRMHIEAEFRPAKVVVLIPWCHLSGAARVAGYLADALARIYDPRDIVVIRTETSEMDFPEWFPTGARHVDFAEHAQALKGDNRHRLLVSFVRSLQPTDIFNVNSATFWQVLSAYGVPLSCCARIYSYLFCSEMDIYGNVAGYPVRSFQPTFAVHKKFFTDSDFLRDQLSERFHLPLRSRTKIVKLATPLSDEITKIPVPPVILGRRREVFWAGRFDRQKRVDIVYEIARRMPDVTFRMWGKPVLDRSILALTVPENVRHEGLYQVFSDLPLDQCDAWLYTSEWDGVPNILLDVAAAGLPLVGSLAGGTSEVLRENVSWPIERIENVDDYIKALRAIFADPTVAREKAAVLRAQIKKERTVEAYTASIRNAMESVDG